MSDVDRSYMGLAQARAAMDVGYRVVVFLNVRGPELAARYLAHIDD